MPGNDLQGRINLALALISHRKPTPEVMELIRLALLGASTADLYEVERRLR